MSIERKLLWDNEEKSIHFPKRAPWEKIEVIVRANFKIPTNYAVSLVFTNVLNDQCEISRNTYEFFSGDWEDLTPDYLVLVKAEALIDSSNNRAFFEQNNVKTSDQGSQQKIEGASQKTIKISSQDFQAMMNNLLENNPIIKDLILEELKIITKGKSGEEPQSNTVYRLEEGDKTLSYLGETLAKVVNEINSKKSGKPNQVKDSEERKSNQNERSSLNFSDYFNNKRSTNDYHQIEVNQFGDSEDSKNITSPNYKPQVSSSNRLVIKPSQTEVNSNAKTVDLKNKNDIFGINNSSGYNGLNFSGKDFDESKL